MYEGRPAPIQGRSVVFLGGGSCREGGRTPQRRGGSQRETRGPGIWAPFTQKRPPQHRPRPPQTIYWAPLARKRRRMHRTHGPACSDAPAHFVWGRRRDGPGPRKENNTGRPPQHQPQLRQTKHGAPRTHTHTHEATRTGPTAEQTSMTRRTLRREDRVTVPGPVRKPAKYEMSYGGGGGGGDQRGLSRRHSEPPTAVGQKPTAVR